ncbi:MAG: biotin/lipoate A/B protein ligase family protein [Candidatus Aenigmatarchaeota archaeon]
MKWRLLPFESRSAAMNMGIDQAVTESVSRGGPPTIRFWRWQPSAVSIGYFQSLEDEIALEKCKELGVDVVRRITGGGAVYHDYDGEITYSVIGNQELFPKGIIDSYHLICGWIINSLKLLGIESEFKPINDIIVAGKKISGNAQTRRQNVLLQHGTILYDLDVRKMFSLLKVGQEKISDKMIQSVEDRVTRILDQKQVSMEETYQSLVRGFTEGKDYEEGQLTEEELTRAKEVAESKYSQKEWNFMR